MGSSGWEFLLLGPLGARWDGEEVDLGAPQDRSTFALLLLSANEVVSRDRIADELWGERPPASAKVQIQGLVSHLRRALRLPVIHTRGTGYLLEVAPGDRDTDVFTERVTAGRRHVAAGDPAQGVRLLREALALWRGPLLADVPLPAVASAREQWAELRLAATEDLLQAKLDLGCHQEVLTELTTQIAANPFRERLRGQQMTALARTGRIADALAVYRDWDRELRTEIGVEPSPALRVLHSGILRAEPGLRPASYSAVRRAPAPCQLPADLSDFAGRRDLLDELGTSLRPRRGRAAPPTIVVSGIGGIGKTSLAVKLAHQVRRHFPDGQLYVSLRGTGPAPVPATTALTRCLQSLGVPADMIPADVDECASLYRDMLTGRRVLLVLDDGADESQVRPLLPGEPGCAVLITSRSRLSGLAGARPVPLNVLSSRDSEELLAGLVGRSRLTEDAAAAGLVIDHCGGLPLALRIVGSRLAARPHWALTDVAGSLSVERERLDWLVTGDLAVRSSFALSHRQLDPVHRRLFRLLGLLPAVEFPGWVPAALLGVDVPVGERLLDDLVGRHMVEAVGRSRYRLHDLLRCFAWEPATVEDAGPAVERVLGGWLWLAERAADLLPGSVLRARAGTARRWPVGERVVADPLSWFDTESAALEAAIAQAAELGMGELAWELANVCAVYFDHRGLNAEWCRCHTRALAAATLAGRDRGVATLLRGLGQLHIYWDEFPQAVRTIVGSRLISERIGDRHGVAKAIAGMATVHRETGRFDKATRMSSHALGMLIEAGDAHGAVQARLGLAHACMAQNRLVAARDWLDAALAEAGNLSDPHRLANVLRVYGQFHLRRDEIVEAMGFLFQAMEMLDAINDNRCTAHVLLQLGHAYAKLGDERAARDVLLDASEQFVDAGNGSGEAACAHLLGQFA